jgi:Domain of unknown function (DUF4839)
LARDSDNASPAAGQSLTAAPRLTVDRSCGDGATESTTAPTETAPVPSNPPATSSPEPEEILTAATSDDLSALLTEPNDCRDTIEHLAARYRGRTIEFDGNIATMSKHGDEHSRYDILVRPRDYSETSAIGPSFQFKDVNISFDLHLTGSNIPESLRQGDNLHVIAQVEDYNSTQRLLFLDPVSTEVR